MQNMNNTENDMFKQISDWIDNTLINNFMDNIVAIAFNLYDDGNNTWSLEMVGTSEFDIDDSDWACNELSDFGTRDNPFVWNAESSWEDILQSVSTILKKYLEEGKNADRLKMLEGIGVGFVDGDIEILYA